MSMHGEEREQKPPGVPPRGFVHYQKPISAVHVIPSDNFLYTKRVSMACTASHPPRCILSRRPTSAQAPPPGDQWMGKCCHPNRWTQIALLWSTTTPPTKKTIFLLHHFPHSPQVFHWGSNMNIKDLEWQRTSVQMLLCQSIQWLLHRPHKTGLRNLVPSKTACLSPFAVLPHAFNNNLSVLTLHVVVTI